MPSELLIETVLTALRTFGGYFVWRADDGQEYVITSRQEFEARTHTARDTQLGLLNRAVLAEATGARWTADDMLEKINRDLALYQLQQEQEEEIELDEELDNNTKELPLAPLPGKPFEVPQGKRVRFEPLRGDLPPSLQE